MVNDMLALISLERLSLTPNTWIPSVLPLCEAILKPSFVSVFSWLPQCSGLIQCIYGSFCQIKILWCVLIHIISWIWPSVTVQLLFLTKVEMTVKGKCLKAIQDIMAAKTVQPKILRKEDFQKCFAMWQEWLGKYVWSKEHIWRVLRVIWLLAYFF